MNDEQWLDAISGKSQQPLSEHDKAAVEKIRSALKQREQATLPYNGTQLDNAHTRLMQKIDAQASLKETSLEQQPLPAEAPKISNSTKISWFRKLPKLIVPLAVAASVAMVTLNVFVPHSSLEISDYPTHYESEKLRVGNRSSEQEALFLSESIKVTSSDIDRDTLKLLSFLKRDGYPYQWEEDNGSRKFQFLLLKRQLSEINKFLEPYNVSFKEYGVVEIVFSP